MLYIMRGYHFDETRVTVEDIIKETGGDFSIIVGQREYGYDKYASVFVIGSGDETDMKLGSYKYTQDTGMGHQNRGKEFIVDNVIYVNKDGVIDKHINDIGTKAGEKRAPWVFK